MMIKGRVLDGAPSFNNAEWRLQAVAGSARWFPEFTPVD